MNFCTLPLAVLRLAMAVARSVLAVVVEVSTPPLGFMMAVIFTSG